MEKKGARISRRTALPMDKVVEMYIKDMKIASGLNTQRIFAAWDEVSGMGAYTIGRFFRNGTLWVNLSSSMARSQLWFRRETLVKKINEALAADPLFTADDPKVGYVKNLILK